MGIPGGRAVLFTDSIATMTLLVVVGLGQGKKRAAEGTGLVEDGEILGALFEISEY